MRFLRDQRVRRGIAVASILMIVAVAFRFAASQPDDRIHYAELTSATGVQFGDWPDVFYGGADGDGEVFAVLAADPLGMGPSRHIPSVIYRYSRIGFSLLGWGGSLGQETNVLPALFAIGLASVGAVGFLAGFLSHELGLRAWLLAANPALFIGFVGDTAEPLALAFLIAGFVSTGILGAILLGATRPTYGVALLGRWNQVFTLGVVAVAIRIAAVVIFGGSIFDSAADSFALPGLAYFSEPSWLGFIVLGAGIVTLLEGIRKRDLAWTFSGLLVLVLGTGVTRDPINLFRAAGMLPVIWAFGHGKTATTGAKVPAT